MADKKMMLAKDVAALLRVTTAQVYKLAREGTIPSLKVGGSVRFLKSAIHEWIAEQSRVGA